MFNRRTADWRERSLEPARETDSIKFELHEAEIHSGKDEGSADCASQSAHHRYADHNYSSIR